MTFKAYLRKANKLAMDKPELLQMEVVNASKRHFFCEESNSFTPVEFGASAGFFIEDKKEFILEGEFELMELPEDTKVNAVCIN